MTLDFAIGIGTHDNRETTMYHNASLVTIDIVVMKPTMAIAPVLSTPTLDTTATKH